MKALVLQHLLEMGSIKSLLKTQSKDINKLKKQLTSMIVARNNVVLFCYSNGISAIEIAELLGCSRQMVYKIIETDKQGEEEWIRKHKKN